MNELHVFHYKELFAFNLPVLITAKRIFVVDTYMGPKSIKNVLKLCNEKKEGRKVYAVNSHSHFDHIWGNFAFSEDEIIASEKCREIIEEEGKKVLKEISEHNPEWIMEPVEIVLPTITFKDEMVFADSSSDVKIRFLPGHTEDSAVVIVMPEKILLAGDMVEDPFPLLEGENIDLYLANLKWLKNQNLKRVIPSHGKREDPALIEENIIYIEEMKKTAISLMKENKEVNEKTVPLEKLLRADREISPFYIDSHKNNIMKMKTFLEKRQIQDKT